MNHSIKLYLYFLIIIIVSLSCANRKSPTGGPKDEVGPKIIKTIPENKSLNFKGKELYFEFDEYVKEDNFIEKVIISPSIDSTFTHKVVKKRLYLEFAENLKENTTYTINLGEAIKDISEGNSGVDLQLTFSTGNFLDSLNIEGSVFDIASGKGSPNILVGLYNPADTLTIFNSKPTYIAKTNAEGKFSLQNLRSDAYLLYAWNDRDKNLMYSNQTEQVGFESDTIKLDSSIQNIKIPIQKFDLRKLKVFRQESDIDISTIEFNKGLTDIKFSFPDDSTKKILYSASKEKNLITIYNTFNIIDSVFIKAVARDSFDIKLDTTFKVFFEPKEEKKNNKKNKKEDEEYKRISVVVQPSDNLILSTDEIELSFKAPIKQYTLDTLYFFKDSLTTYPLKEEDLLWNDNQTSMKITRKIDFKDTIKFKAGLGTFIDVKGDSSSEVIQTFLTKTTDKFSSIGGTVEIDAPDFIIILENKEGKNPRKLFNQKNFKFDYLSPGSYSLKVVVDKNGNKEWDRGDLTKKIEPERIIYFKPVDGKGKESSELTIKANWEILDNVIKDSE